jgi:hypothetical protein
MCTVLLPPGVNPIPVNKYINTINFVVCVLPICVSIRTSAWNNATSTERIFIKFDTRVFLENLSKKFKYLQEVRCYFHNRVRVILLICSKSQLDDDPIESKHVAVWILRKVVFDGCLFTAYFKVH